MDSVTERDRDVDRVIRGLERSLRDSQRKRPVLLWIVVLTLAALFVLVNVVVLLNV